MPHRDKGLVLVVTSTYKGLPPTNAKPFADWLPADAASAALKHVAFSVLGGSIDERLRALGAQCVAVVGNGDMGGGQKDVEFMRWTLDWTVGLFQSERIPMPETMKTARIRCTMDGVCNICLPVARCPRSRGSPTACPSFQAHPGRDS